MEALVKDVKGFCEFEARNDLFSRMYLGFPYWQLVRMSICEGVFDEAFDKRESVRLSKNKLKFVAEILKGIYYSIKSYVLMHWIGEHDVICFKSSKLHDRFYDYWKMPDAVNFVNIRGINSVSDIRQDDKYNLLGPCLRANMNYAVKKLFHLLEKDPDERLYIESFVALLEKKYGKCPSADYIENAILRYIEYQKQYKPFFETLFSRTRCKAIVVVWYYQTPLMIAYEVAKRRHIRIIELQHGIISNHEEYWFEDQRGIYNFTPDYFLAFGEQQILWTKMLPTTMCLAVGNPHQDFCVHQFNGIQTDEKAIVIYPTMDENFEEIINEFVTIISNKEYKIYMKIHPNEVKGYEAFFPILAKNKNIEIVTDQSKGIYYWLKLGKHHIMANTTVGLEALAFEHTNICVATFVDHQQLQPLLDSGCARGFYTADELVALVQTPLGERGQFSEKIWRKNGAKNVNSFFENMCNQNWPDTCFFNNGGENNVSK